MSKPRSVLNSSARGVFAGLIAMLLGTMIFAVVLGTSLDTEAAQFDPENPENSLALVGYAAFLMSGIIPNVFAGFVSVRRHGTRSLTPAFLTAAVLVLVNLTANLVRGGTPVSSLLLMPVVLVAAAAVGGLLGRRHAV